MLLGGECDAGLSPWREIQFPKPTPQVVKRAFPRDDGTEEVQTELFFVTSKGNTNFNPRKIAEEFMDKVQEFQK